jgi:hypothetical protein
MFSTENQSVESKYVGYGIHEVTVVGMSKAEDDSAFFLELKLKGEDDENASKFRFSVTSPNGEEKAKKALDFSLKKMRHIQDVLLSQEAITKLNTPPPATIEEFVTRNNAALKGKSLRMKFAGRQYEYNGKIGWKTEIPLPFGGPFAEPMVDNGQKNPAVLNMADTQLEFNKVPADDNYDYVPLKNQPSSVSESNDSDTPWE